MHIAARFPEVIWNGITGNRNSLSDDKEPNEEDWDRIAAEIIALENFVKPVIVRVATTTALVVTSDDVTLTNADTQAALVIDSIVMAVGDLVLVKDQDDTDNDVYIVTDIGSDSSNWMMARYGSGFIGRTIIISGGVVNNNTVKIQTAEANFSLN